MKAFKKFKGVGSMIEFIDAFNRLAKLITSANVVLSGDKGGSQSAAFFREEGGALILDMQGLDFGGLPPMTGKTDSMVLQITDQTTETADWDWVKAGPTSTP